MAALRFNVSLRRICVRCGEMNSTSNTNPTAHHKYTIIDDDVTLFFIFSDKGSVRIVDFCVCIGTHIYVLLSFISVVP